MTIHIETARLQLRDFTLDDAPAFYRLGSDSQVIRYTGDPGGGFRDLDQAIEVFNSHTLRDYAVHGYGRWACVHREDGHVIGFAGLKFLDELDAVDIGYRFLPEYWGQGLATESAKPVLQYGFETLGLSEILGLAMPDNAASVRVLEKIGMRPAGTLQYGGLEVLKYVAGVRTNLD